MRQRRIRDIVIELTSLLDVVMILIFAVMIENSKLVKAGQEELILANGTIEQMQSDMETAQAEHEAETKKIVGDYEQKLDEKAKELDDKKIELNEKENAVAAAKEQLDAVNAELDTVKGEKDEISEELKVALRKLSEGDIDELLKRIENAELKNKGYEYMDKLVVVYNVGIESYYENETAQIPLYRTLSFGRAGTKKEDVSFQIKGLDDIGFYIEQMNLKLSENIDKALSDTEASVFLVFSYNSELTLNRDKRQIIEALTGLTERYGETISYRVNEIEE